ncbi:MAG: hypothetical protein CBD88_08210 [Flavobacteriales bacterium TMED228]|nr:MAG: hypothetical protein CBD88_08210 [Flavobacteriales bacterium TMED228]
MKVKTILAIVLLLMPSCAATSGDGSKWKNMGPDQVRCERHELKICGIYGSLHICECKMA